MNSNENLHEPLVDQALVGFDLAAEHHMAHCQPCQIEREKVEEALRQFGAANREYTSRPESFYEQQAARIREAQQASRQSSRMTLALVPSLVVLVVLAMTMLGKAPAVRPVAAAAQVQQVDSDHELLVQVERAIQSETPRALEPLTLMLVEDDGNRPLGTSSERKENRSHEN